MAMSHQQNTFVPPNKEQRDQALGETANVCIDYSQLFEEEYFYLKL
jgi:hypothetical protein